MSRIELLILLLTPNNGQMHIEIMIRHESMMARRFLSLPKYMYNIMINLVLSPAEERAFLAEPCNRVHSLFYCSILFSI